MYVNTADVPVIQIKVISYHSCVRIRWNDLVVSQQALALGGRFGLPAHVLDVLLSRVGH